MKISLMTLLVLLTACSTPGPDRVAPPADRIAAECALLTQAAAEMTLQGLAVHEGLSEGCPGTSARDTRPLPVQSASTRAANAAPLPAGLAAGSRAEAVFRRMITRGVPVTIATALVATDGFRRASR